MENEPENHTLFCIRGHRDEFYAGTTRDGEQLLMGLLCPHIVAFFFSGDGTLLRTERRDWQYPAPRMGADGPYRIYDPEFQRMLANQISTWQELLGFSPGPAQVRAFFDEALWVGTEDTPDHLQDLDDSDDDSDDLRAELESWRDSGRFVFHWAKDYFMSRTGAVDST